MCRSADASGGILDFTALQVQQPEGEGGETLTMRRRIITALMLSIMSTLTFSAPGYAAHQGTDHQGPPVETGHPFCGSGKEYADKHITSLAKQQGLGPAHGHTPGFHQGFAVCDPAGIF